ncbi:MAG: 1-acyl-sn-glycerol-3-phosphate acyltransferase [Bacteroidaceae bacterium]|nr:1-acyl-sn-glycerol-3-phosphate acyltransferase [Bacteroidaceae bacterium]
MYQRICSKILYDWLGWSANVTIPHPSKYVIAMAPHTSNWDFIIGQLYSGAEGIRTNFMMKKEWFFWPMGILMRSLGGIPVYRDKKMKSTDILAKQAMEMSEFRLCITPEGTRKATSTWKRGFYYIALKANIPILLYAVDYEKRVIACTKQIIPNGDIEAQMAEIKEYFKDFSGKHPEKFSI